MHRSMTIACLAALLISAPWNTPARASDTQAELPLYLRDRGAGMPTSMFGTYIEEGELLVYPFFEYYRDDDAEYKPAELGFELEEDFRGMARASEGLLFLSYGFTDRLAVEIEAAVISATLEKSPGDPSATPDKIEESGTGDVEGQIRYRWRAEDAERPEIVSFFVAVTPQQKDKVLIGTPDWELKLGTGFVRGFPWGTMTVRAAVEYDAAESKAELGEYALEYLKKISPAFRAYLGVEGSQDEVEFIPEAQLRLAKFVTLKLNSAVGITSKATDWAPEVGLMFSFGGKE